MPTPLRCLQDVSRAISDAEVRPTLQRIPAGAVQARSSHLMPSACFVARLCQLEAVIHVGCAAECEEKRMHETPRQGRERERLVGNAGDGLASASAGNPSSTSPHPSEYRLNASTAAIPSGSGHSARGPAPRVQYPHASTVTLMRNLHITTMRLPHGLFLLPTTLAPRLRPHISRVQVIRVNFRRFYSNHA